jgi:hypothetical protein
VTLLLDTSVVSELRKRQPDRNLLAWYAARADTLELWLRGLEAGYRDHLIGVEAANRAGMGPHKRP